MQYCSLQHWTLLLSPVRSTAGYCFCFGSIPSFFLVATPWIAARQASLSITSFRNPPEPMSIESVMPSNYLILCRPLLLLTSIFPSIRVFTNKSVLCIRWPNYWSFSFSISPSNDYSGMISFRIHWFDLLAEWINDKVLLYRTGNYTQYLMINHNGKTIFKMNIYKYVYGASLVAQW